MDSVPARTGLHLLKYHHLLEYFVKKRAPRLGLFKVSRQRPTFTHSKNALSSALQALTSEVGMGSGVAPVLKSSKNQKSIVDFDKQNQQQ